MSASENINAWLTPPRKLLLLLSLAQIPYTFVYSSLVPLIGWKSESLFWILYTVLLSFYYFRLTPGVHRRYLLPIGLMTVHVAIFGFIIDLDVSVPPLFTVIAIVVIGLPMAITIALTSLFESSLHNPSSGYSPRTLAIIALGCLVIGASPTVLSWIWDLAWPYGRVVGHTFDAFIKKWSYAIPAILWFAAPLLPVYFGKNGYRNGVTRQLKDTYPIVVFMYFWMLIGLSVSLHIYWANDAFDSSNIHALDLLLLPASIVVAALLALFLNLVAHTAACGFKFQVQQFRYS